MNIIGDEPDFKVALRLKSMTEEMFKPDEWRQIIGLDEAHHELILTMHEVGLIEMTIKLIDGAQTPVWRLK